jgi:hypothetical protein
MTFQKPFPFRTLRKGREAIRAARADNGVQRRMPLARGLGMAQIPKIPKAVESRGTQPLRLFWRLKPP